MERLVTDYLVVGAGASALAFVDTLLDESDAKVLMVDRRERVGGHWVDAYPFVRVHQPSAWYGLPSRELSRWTRDTTGANAGLDSLATQQEVLAHFDAVVAERFRPSGRVEFLPRWEYVGRPDDTHCIRSLETGELRTVEVRRKLVNATHANTEIPATHPPRYEVAAGVDCIPIHQLPDRIHSRGHYTVVGSGKTGMDACLWLIEQGIPPSRIRWIMPRDAWLQDRANFQPGPDGIQRYMDAALAQFRAIAEARDLRDVFARLEAAGVLMRIDPAVEPTTYRCAIVSRGELARLRSVGEIVRMGRVHAIERDCILLQAGAIAAQPDTLYVNCSAGAIQPTPDLPIFGGDTINLLMVRYCQPLMSAALLAWVECHVPGDDAARNALAAVVPGPELPADWVRTWGITLRNMGRWRENEQLMQWLARCRLNAQVVMMRGVQPTPALQEQMKLLAAVSMQAAQRVPSLLGMAS